MIFLSSDTDLQVISILTVCSGKLVIDLIIHHSCNI